MIEHRNLLAQWTKICDDVEIDTELLLHSSSIWAVKLIVKYLHLQNNTYMIQVVLVSNMRTVFITFIFIHIWSFTCQVFFVIHEWMCVWKALQFSVFNLCKNVCVVCMCGLFCFAWSVFLWNKLPYLLV